MAVKDVREFFYATLAQYTEMKQDLADFEQAFKDGYITEDKLTEVKEQVNIVEANFQRIGYIMYLLEAPNRPNKKEKYNKQNKDLLQAFAANKADSNAISNENKSALKALKAELVKLTEKK